MTRSEFLAVAERLQDFILDSIEEFCVNAGHSFDRETFLQEGSTDFAQLAVEALFFGTDAYSDPLSDDTLAA